ncbi:Gfo/Idh/MocA family oxidoreductase [Chitinophaga pendula]|uniref:Gfo/Idh/MocA family oxidoreductase n=1 Tax=Chitinophaga TaxID=79328 RepID=UPI000BAEC9DE|nr:MULTISPECIES: Gfo/Idh/MocA family oxidoreductase [Chitinophaga]ASZ13473.1 oxidoreductase [Chitinophaga sp. MD30]UCJ08900.1 Gfo/Idh/MocA family oxidoreductase [Chitinophaga pendula]
MKQNDNSRRSFLKNALLLSAAAAAGPSLLKAKGLPAGPRRISSNERVNLACIGIGNRGAEIIEALYKTGLANIVALCDVDMGAPHTLNILKQFPDVPRFQDFRQLFDKMGNQIDAVSIGVPDFSHFPITMMAMGLGKHVYVEKPMARTFNEVELMMKAARKYNKVVTQMGNQGHSEANYFQFKAWKDAGIIKDVTAITAHMNSPRRWHGWDPHITSFPPAQQVPDTLDWDIWQMATQGHQYNKEFVNGQWRCWFDFGMGALGDWGAHILDTAHQFLDMGLPSSVAPLKLSGHNNFFYPMSSTLLFQFPKRGNMPAIDVTWYDGVDNLPPIPKGYGVSGLDPNIPPPSTGKIEPAKLNPGKIIYSKELIFKGGSHGSTLSIIPEEKAKEMASRLPEVPASPSNHFKNFLLACKGQEETRSPFAIAGPLSQVFCLGVLAQWTGSKLEFDRNKKIITNNKKANELLVGPPPRKGWEQYYKV